ncbi:Z1 domain-containing protein [Aliarcobacter butzleri]|uniref:Z1 domain-containing protein n=1 Tax=Aliarcobacter butzleri TaxID=28197 RepID=UPI00125FFE44|nr:Z1 domain-containing protein [Aliarcobacter butzleri]
MQMNLYEEVKEFLLNKLNKQYKLQEYNLESSDIERELNNIKTILSSDIKNHFFINYMENLVDKDFIQLRIEVEKHFDVKMEEGIIIKGVEQQQRDTTWWSNKVKLEQEKNDSNYYWNRLKKYHEKSLPPEVIKTIDEDTDMVMDNIGNPSLEEFDIYGMVVGHVQSGKTANYSSLLCKAADAGYKFIVVIAGDKNNLRDQTQERLNEAFLGKNDNKLVGVGLIESNNIKIPISLTTVEKDFNIRDADKNSQGGLNFDNSFTTPILLVIKKNTSTLTNVISWIKSQSNNRISNHAMLVIDDESDYASINTKDEEDPTTINKKIRALLNLFHKSSYVAYTATPYANIFIDHEVKEMKNVYLDNKNKENDLSEDLFPSDFIYALDAPSNYFGAREIFIKNTEKYIININDYQEIIPTNHKKDDDLTTLPNSLYEAISIYILNISIRYLRKQGNKHNSMLIHISRFSDMHSKIAFLVNSHLQIIKADIKSYGKLQNAETQSLIIKKLHDLYIKKLDFVEFKWEDILSKLVDIIDTIVVREEHQKSKLRIEYRKDITSNIIAVGGMSLARGFTLEGLSVSYFIRSTIFYDTLMQMGRWFGYRTGYEDLCKIYMPLETENYFRQIIEATEELMLDFKEIAKENKTPLDFGLAVKQHPDSLLQVTAKNKRKNTQVLPHKMNLNGVLKETVRFSKEQKVHAQNLSVLVDLVKGLDYKLSDNKSPFIFREIERETIEKFLNDFIIHKRSVIDNLMPIKFIQEYVKNIDTKWDIVLYSGKQQEIAIGSIITQAQLRNNPNDKGDYIELARRKASSGTPELILLDKDLQKEINAKDFQKGEKSRYIRKRLKNPVLMLHILDIPEFCKTLPAFGVCFPDNGFGHSQTVEYIINSVYIKELEEQMRYEEEYDD